MQPFHAFGYIVKKFCLPLLLLVSFSFVHAATVVETHGALSVKGNKIINQHGSPAAFAGPSLFWSNTGWNGDRFYHAGVVTYLQREWNATIIRASMGTEKNGGYEQYPEENIAKVERVVDAAIAEGMYVIIDWHAHHAEKNPQGAIEFFEHMARKYGAVPNAIYEIYNEPLADTDWSTTVKPYAEKLIARIRAIDPDNLIIVGTQTWSQDVDKAAADPIKGYKNIAYALHFYAGTHKKELRDKAKQALDSGIALMVTEWGSVNANGDGDIDREEAQRWVAFMREHNLSHCKWALNDKKESASMLKPGTKANGKWTDADLTAAGLFAKEIILNWDKTDYSGSK